MAGAGLGAWAVGGGGLRVRSGPFAHPMCAFALPLWAGRSCCPLLGGVGGT